MYVYRISSTKRNSQFLSRFLFFAPAQQFNLFLFFQTTSSFPLANKNKNSKTYF